MLSLGLLVAFLNTLLCNDSLTGNIVLFLRVLVALLNNLLCSDSLTGRPWMFIALEALLNLGVTLDQNLSFQQHVSRTCQICYFELRRINSIRHYMSQDALKTLISAFVLSRIASAIPYSLAVLSSSFTNFKKFRTTLQGSSVELLSLITHLLSITLFTGFLLTKELNTNCFSVPSNL